MTLRSLLLFALVSAAVGACAANRPPGSNLPVREGPSEETDPENIETRLTRGSQADIPYVESGADHCTFGRRRPPVTIMYRDRDGLDVSGEIPPQNYARFPRSVPTAVARPIADTYRIVLDNDCYDPQENVYYSCPQVHEVAVGEVRAIGRAETVEQAERLAIRACRERAYATVYEQLQVQQESYDLHCRIVERSFCERPAAPGPAASREEPGTGNE